MLTEKDYCDYDTYVALEELGYPEVMAFNKPLLLYEAQKWLREKHNLHIEVRWYSDLLYEYEVKEIEGKKLAEVTFFETYEEALSEGIKKAIEILKEK